MRGAASASITNTATHTLRPDVDIPSRWSPRGHNAGRDIPINQSTDSVFVPSSNLHVIEQFHCFAQLTCAVRCIALLYFSGWLFVTKIGESYITTVSADSTCTAVNLATGGMFSSLRNSGPNGPRVLAFANIWVDFNRDSFPAEWTPCIRNVVHAFKNYGFFRQSACHLGTMRCMTCKPHLCGQAGTLPFRFHIGSVIGTDSVPWHCWE